MALATGGAARLGQQHSGVGGGGPTFLNPGKYEIPAGGMGDGYYRPSLNLIRDIDKQTLVNGSVSFDDSDANSGGIGTDRSRRTQMSFTKYLREPEEIEIDPFESTLLLYAVALEHRMAMTNRKATLNGSTHI